MAGEKIDNRPYWMQRRDAKLGQTVSKQEEAKQTKDELKVWFDERAKESPSKCENCGNSLQSTINFHPRAHICHIVKKGKEAGGCPSVATHPLNRWFGCKTCHDAYDNESDEVVSTMYVIPICKARVKVFYGQIAANEVRRVPYFLRPDLTDEIKIATEKKPKLNASKTKKSGGKKTTFVPKRNGTGKPKTRTDKGRADNS